MASGVTMSGDSRQLIQRHDEVVCIIVVNREVYTAQDIYGKKGIRSYKQLYLIAETIETYGLIRA